MIGFFLIYFIEKKFYSLAEESGRKKWLFGVLAVVCSYVGLIIGAVLIRIGYVFFNLSQTSGDFRLSLLAVPFGLMATFGFYFLLKNNWKDLRFSAEMNRDQQRPRGPFR